MSQRYFIEVSYLGTHYNGFQVQPNAPTIQGSLQQVLKILFRKEIQLTGSSRTDAGVHALQNYFHFDTDLEFDTDKYGYSINALLPYDIAVKRIFKVAGSAHARFDAVYREYKYYISRHKDPFHFDTAYKYGHDLDISALNKAAALLLQYTDFTTFSKLNTQVYTNNCTITLSEWSEEDGILVYHVRSNRFLRGMVRALVGTMLRVGRGIITVEDFKHIIESKDCAQADFSTPAKGLFLVKVVYPQDYNIVVPATIS
ncbi:tRNA pseudouridine(38-40) synthase TruA [Haoranjiania flava]|uniref:tRNA pseudouridine synthase A n=1 Tax=Haoranjiania flava TaxID=1856322 RepID=A0AAE3IKF3_9BACT|nr:tRNA pseudouridine(38-40) synthase TruA [Haoranjiania flava]MCU7693429.1 tRNA pseudouridine(38-40) synthase TruA [Haoranjiania flava]